MEVGEAVVLHGGKKGKVIEKTYKFKDGIRFSIIRIEDEEGKILKIKIRDGA